MRLVVENGIEEAAATLRRLADELEGMPGALDDGGPTESPPAV